MNKQKKPTALSTRTPIFGNRNIQFHTAVKITIATARVEMLQAIHIKASIVLQINELFITRQFLDTSKVVKEKSYCLINVHFSLPLLVILLKSENKCHIISLMYTVKSVLPAEPSDYKSRLSNYENSSVGYQWYNQNEIEWIEHQIVLNMTVILAQKHE